MLLIVLYTLGALDRSSFYPNNSSYKILTARLVVVLRRLN